ncbi:MAG: hypothetical protein JWN50_688 [Parcubacteria group bacterium]|nr:hypothetical protein [Parcubacteria group bacterium]
MILAVEDILSESVARKLVNSIRPDITIRIVLGKKGRGYLQNKALELNRSASSTDIFLLADLDNQQECPAVLISSWLASAPQGPRLLFRFAVTEIESWILADREAFADFLRIPFEKLPQQTDTILQPKEMIVNLARKSRLKKMKTDLVPRLGGTASVGPLYNSIMSGFVSEHWDPERAKTSSASLFKAIDRLKAF